MANGKKRAVEARTAAATEPARENHLTVAEKVAGRIRDMVIGGVFTPGQHLLETTLSEKLEVSRNTLREVFRLLTKEGLLRHEPNRGVFVVVPSVATIVDLYRVRRMIERQAIAQAHPKHPAASRMRLAVADAQARRDKADWIGVGSADIAFHTAIIDLADSMRLSRFFAHIAAETRLAFGLVNDPEFLHAPFIDLNLEILTLLEGGKPSTAAAHLDAYLVQAERIILGAFARAAPENN
jgi:DNA-binding GntR family transcriptional regulator